MIVSVSRRTDVPAFYGEWFMNRIRAGFCTVRNPFNPNQTSRMSLRPEDVDCLVFWTKDPAPFLVHLDELDRLGYRYYFLYTLNRYPEAFEPGVSPVEQRIETFHRLSERLSLDRVIWRYDPIVITDRTGPEFHRQAFADLSEALAGYTNRVIVSLVQFYRKTSRRLSGLEGLGYKCDPAAAEKPETLALLAELAWTAAERGIEMAACADERDYSGIGIRPSRCIDGELIERLWGLAGPWKKDPGQRKACGCAVSRDIGAVDTCLHDCVYCYATVSEKAARTNRSRHDPTGEALFERGGRGF